jgi:hypothetical protein
MPIADCQLPIADWESPDFESLERESVVRNPKFRIGNPKSNDLSSMPN